MRSSSPSGGNVHLTIRPAERTEDVVVIVRDSGVGIPSERQRAIFDAFVQADQSDARRFEGLGMGLALVQRAAQLLGGQIAVESVPGQGSEFAVTLPGAVIPATTSTNPTAPSPVLPASTPQVSPSPGSSPVRETMRAR
jgi:signal transduction histidine kinase